MSGFTGFRFPPEVIVLAVRWYLRFALSYRDIEELLSERRLQVDHVIVYRWVQRFTPLLVEAARLCRHRPGARWFIDETYVKVSGRWTYLYRAAEQHVLASERRDQAAARRFFVRALAQGRRPVEVTTDKAPVYPRILDELLPEACHVDAARENNRIEADHGRLKARLRPMRGLKRLRSAQTVSAGHALVQNIRRGHYELGIDSSPQLTPQQSDRRTPPRPAGMPSFLGTQQRPRNNLAYLQGQASGVR
ncbi:Transposase (or an inactivated derivative) [Parafrankia irregularis]|uniref:Transposase (Or an inactivated derivative) n=1 Tax=Parafrankia irregularis TaxID=795642 RepID=A0A0S4QLG2_9ACTN|nr:MULTISPECIES: IS6 family transposase [Parafrankia]CUU55370.1 Transposase (or an inactivated derivative) [Parafrankia irregularis]